MILNKSSLFRLSPLLLLIFIDSFSYFVVIPVLLTLFYVHHVNFLPTNTSLTTRDILTGITIALSPCATLIAAPFIGSASDQYGRKKTLLACLLCVAAGFLFPIIGILKKSVALILIGRFIAGLGSASQAVAQAAVADLCHEKDKAIALSWIAIMMTVALIMGPLAGGYLSDTQLTHYFNATTPYVFALTLSIINLFLLIFCFTETLQKKTASTLRQTITALPQMIKRYHIGITMLIFFLLELGWSQYYQSISVFLKLAAHDSVQMISIFNAYLGAIMSLGLLVLYPLFLRIFRVKTIMRVSIVGVTIGLIGCSLLGVSPWHSVLAGIVAIFTGIGYVSLVAITSNHVDPEHQGVVMGYLSTLLYLAWMLTAFDGGVLIAYHVTLPLYLSALFIVVGCVVVVTTINKKGMPSENSI